MFGSLDEKPVTGNILGSKMEAFELVQLTISDFSTQTASLTSTFVYLTLLCA